MLSQISNILFPINNMGAITLNPAAFGELVVIIRHIKSEPLAMNFWSVIHPRIKKISFDDNTIMLGSLQPGEYVLEIIAHYPQGDVCYGIKLFSQ